MLKTTLASLLLAMAAMAFAGDPVTDAMQKAYVPYRVALFKTNSNSATEAQQAIDAAKRSWQDVVARFGSNPPAPFDRDREFGAALAEIAGIFDRAAIQIGGNELSRAHETLERVREVFAAIRARNNVVVFSDHMNAYHAQMEKVLGDAPSMLNSADGMKELTAAVGVLMYLADRLGTETPTELKDNDEFRMALGAVKTSVVELRAAVFSQESGRVREALGKIKMPYSKMFVRFG